MDPTQKNSENEVSNNHHNMFKTPVKKVQELSLDDNDLV